MEGLVFLCLVDLRDEKIFRVNVVLLIFLFGLRCLEEKSEEIDKQLK